ncbi:hypothetical protein RJ639_030523 [Escallonia herrerae]|uniref:Reverse transcriptase/retrotransposon-derived protein RNase H-like domain-containing protein n=1 Tax=Escallonia herrerae TaxID=1293975 RepID=A0AA89BAU5_9ASTE|nr:hypothetical protein RJ639_030523 [Escallonia herrerae]
MGIINTIFGGLVVRGLSGQAQKAYAREVCIMSQPPSKRQKIVSLPVISFSDDDLGEVKTPHDDPLIITMKAGNFDVKWVLVGNGSSAEILFYGRQETLPGRFEEFKTYLSSPPLLSKPLLGEDLYLYLSVSEVAISVILVREENGIQNLIYYVSNVLHDVEMKYPQIDKVALALITSTRRL